MQAHALPCRVYPVADDISMHIEEMKMGRLKLTCATCAWWVARDTDSKAKMAGSCRYNPPSPNVRNPFPGTMGHHWCRQWAKTRGRDE